MASNDDSNAGGKNTLFKRRSVLTATGAALAASFVGTASAADMDKAIVLEAPAADELYSYSVTVSGDIEAHEVTGDGSYDVSNGTASGELSGGYAAFRYNGTVEDVNTSGFIDIYMGEDAASRVPAQEHTLVVRSPSEISYEFTVDGSVGKVQDGSDVKSEDNDSITENDDGTFTVSGYTGNGYGDSYTFQGSIVEFSPMEGDYTVSLDGEETTARELTGQQRQTLTVSSPSEISYRFTVSGGAEKVQDGSDVKAEDNDSISQNDDGSYTVSGYTGNGYGDSYYVAGEFTAFEPKEGDYTVTLNGEEVTAYDLTGEDPSNSGSSSGDSSSDGPNLGGGDGYADTVPQSEADVVVSSKSELNSALSSASSGDVVYVAGDADIYMGSSEFTVPSGVTLASDRGIDGANGGKIRTDRHPWAMLEAQSNVRITGLRLEGPRWDWESDTVTEMAVDAQGRGIEIDNVEGYGWGYAVVRTNDDTHVHHCQLHHNSRKGHGYGVATEGTNNPIIEYNEFWHNRHSVQGNGGGYTIRYNHVTGDAISHVFDQHRPGGTTMKIYNNTVEVVDNAVKNKKVPAVAIRGVPDDVADIRDNWFYNPEEPRSNPSGWTDEAIIQVHTSSWRNVEFSNNHYGSSDPGSDVGHPR